MPNKTKLHFYKDTHVIRFCKKCGVEYRPWQFSKEEKSPFCYECRKIYKEELKKKYYKYKKKDQTE